MLKKVVKVKLLIIFVGIVTFGIIIIGYLFIPVGKYISIDRNMEDIIAWGEYSPRMRAGNTWLMTDEGLSDGP